MRQCNSLPTSPSAFPSNLSSKPQANANAPIIKHYAAYINQAIYVCGEADSKMHFFVDDSTTPPTFPDIDSNFGPWTLMAFLPHIFTDGSHAFIFSKAKLGSDDWVLFHGGQQLHESAMLRWRSNDSRGMINSAGVVMYGGIVPGLRMWDEVGGDNWHGIWFNRVLRMVYKGSPPTSLLVGE